MLFICHPDAAKKLLEAKPYAFALILTQEDDAPAWLCDYANRVVCLHQKETLSYFVFLIQQYFVQLLIWETELDRAIYQNGTLSDLLNSKNTLIDNPIFILDAKLCLLAHTSGYKQPTRKYQELVRSGCLPHHEFEELRACAATNTLAELPPTGACADATGTAGSQAKGAKTASDTSGQTTGEPFARLACPIYTNGIYFGIAIMLCSNQRPSEGLRDLFAILHKRIVRHCEDFFRQNIKRESPSYFFFCKLLSGERLNDTQLAEQLLLTDIPENPQLKLLTLELRQHDWVDCFAQINDAAKRINNGRCYCVPYNNDLLVICYAMEGDNQLSHLKSREDLARLVHEPFGIACGLSQVFDSITDLDMAYKQTKIVLGLRGIIDNELKVSCAKGTKGIYTFEEALFYYLVSQGEKDERFLRYCFSHTLAQKLYDEDRRYGSNNYELLWFYLAYERNATTVAQHLKLHRNTVLYHIHKLSERFDLDLSLQDARERLLIDFKAHFLLTHRDRLDAASIGINSSPANML